VSANHGKLQLREGVWTLTDLGSTNGSAVDGIPVTDDAPLSPGTVITLGDVDLLFEPHDVRMPRETPTSLLPKAAAPAAAEPTPPSPPVVPAVVATAPIVSEVLVPRSHSRPAPRGQPAARPNWVALVIGIVIALAALGALVFLL